MRIKGTSGTQPAKGHIKSQIPVMSHFECKEQGPGVWQIDRGLKSEYSTTEGPQQGSFATL
jgi:hypothetical protein